MDKNRLAIQYGFFEDIDSFNQMLELNNKISNIELLDMKYHNLIIKECDRLRWERILSGKIDNKEKEELLTNLNIMLSSFSLIIFEKIKAEIIVQLLSDNDKPKLFDTHIKESLFHKLFIYISLLKDKSSILYTKSKSNYNNYNFKLLEDNKIDYSVIPNKNKELIFEKIYKIKDNYKLPLKKSNEILHSISSQYYSKITNKEKIDESLLHSRKILVDICCYFSILEHIFSANLFELNLTLKEILTIVENFIITDFN